MTHPAVGTKYVWLLVVVLGLGTFGLRLSFVHLHGWVAAFPGRAERGLELVPAAVLAALVFSELFVIDGSIAGPSSGVRAIGAGLAAVVAWRTGSMLATIGVGMGVLWGLRLVLV